MSTSETTTVSDSESKLKNYALNVLNEGKWWLVPAATLFSILLLCKYLWVIGHPELLLESIGSIPNLLVWLIFVVFGLLIILLLTVIPSLSFSLCMSIVTSSRENEIILARRFVPIVLLGFALLAEMLLASAFDIIFEPWKVFLLVVTLSTALAAWVLVGNQDKRIRFVSLGFGPIKPWRRFFAAAAKVLAAGAFLGFTAMTGVFPAQLALGAWRGAESGLEATVVIGYCLAFMLISMFPVMAFYTLQGTTTNRLFKATGALGLVFILTTFLLPPVLDLWAFAAGNLMRLRDSRPLPYLVDKADYPFATFDSKLWETSPIANDEKFYTIQAFKQYRFGDILLLCPARYANLPLKRLPTYYDECLTTAASKVKPASPRMKALTFPRPLDEERNCASVRSPTRPPLKINESRTCLFQQPL